MRIEYVVYSGEGHGFNEDENVNDFYTRVERFLADHLKNCGTKQWIATNTKA